MTRRFDPFERRLHIRFAQAGICDVSTETWREILRPAGVGILSEVRLGTSRAYVLSESSLFIRSDEVILVTCGRSNIVQALAGILQHEPPPIDAFMFEARAAEKTSAAERRFAADSERLGGLLPAALGSRTFSDHEACFYFTARCSATTCRTETTRALMHGPRKDPCSESVHVSLRTKLRPMLGEFVQDDWRFEPSGYSANFLGRFGSACMHYSPDAANYLSFELSAPVTSARSDLADLVSVLEPQDWRSATTQF